MKKLVFIIGFIFSAMICFSQDMKTFNLYKPEENAKQQISAAVKEEVSRILPEIVANHLSERFIKAVAADVLSESTQTTSVKRKETKVENKKKNPILSKIIE